ncbi:MAG TPA: hypothetical protein VLZ81_12220, partial [Blastocatellia bacterium]|nr:hypothetical protein [Blastocatellia bacterium]
MKRFIGRIAVLFLCVLSYAGTALATTAIIPNDDQMIIGARAIITAKVLKSASRFDPVTGEVFTYTTLRVNQVLKGFLPYSEVVIKEEGGVTPDHETDVPGSPQFVAGEEVLVYLDTRFDGSLRVHQMFLGKFSIVKDKITGKMVADRGIKLDHVDIRGRAAGAITNRLELSRYVQMVGQRLTFNQSASDEFQAKYYKAAPMLRSPSEYDLSGQGAVPEFTLYPGAPGRWFEPDSGQPIPFVLNPDQEPVPNSVADMQAAMQAWESVSGSMLNLTLTGNSTGCYTVNGPILILFNGCDNRFSPSVGCG